MSGTTGAAATSLMNSTYALTSASGKVGAPTSFIWNDRSPRFVHVLLVRAKVFCFRSRGQTDLEKPAIMSALDFGARVKEKDGEGKPAQARTIATSETLSILDGCEGCPMNRKVWKQTIPGYALVYPGMHRL